ncbi:hypothetical protein AHAS_Ahas06G0196400 [Arachis hypogaea]
MKDKLRKLETELRGRGSWNDRDLIFTGGDDPFSEEIMRAKVRRIFKHLDMDLFDGSIDPCKHLSNFKSCMYFADASDAT